MYWKIEALTAKRSEITQTFEGSLEDVKDQAMLYGLEIFSISPDYQMILKSVFQCHKLSSSILCVFFKDFSDMQRCGLSINEAFNTLNETSSNTTLRKALRKIANSINDGRSLEESFENTKVFPKIVCASLSAAEKTGNITELLEILAQYYKLKSENKLKITRSLIYPGLVFCLLTSLSIFISINLAPQLRVFLPPSSKESLSATILIGYAFFIKNYWGEFMLILVAVCFSFKYFWDYNREKLMKRVFSIPLMGNLIKDIELSHIFLNLYVYQKSGVNIIQAITNIHQANKTYITERLLLIRDKLFKGASLGEAFKQDRFFSPFIYQTLTKGQISGFLPKYFERIYMYYDIKSKESIEVMIATIEPVLVVMAALFLLMILCTFILPVYNNMNQIGGVFK